MIEYFYHERRWGDTGRGAVQLGAGLRRMVYVLRFVSRARWVGRTMDGRVGGSGVGLDVGNGARWACGGEGSGELWSVSLASSLK